ncbi:hypothetical protein ACQKWADRAFT_321959 [Trichoderma austrokoningii]
MNIIKLLSNYQRLRPHTRCHLLQLPLEILLEVFDLLPPYCLLLVCQTCRPLRAITYQYHLPRRGEMLITPQDKVRYLTCLARSLPDQWVCVKCCKLHKTDCFDVPSRFIYHLECEKGFERRDSNSISNRESYAAKMPSHRHVELTLKYARLKSLKWRQQKFLQAPLKPYHIPIEGEFLETLDKNALEQYSFYPKVIDGRYVHLFTQTYLEARNKISRKFLRRERICHHIHGSEGNFTMAVDMAFSAENTQLFFSCSSCGTDFSIQASPERVIIFIWQDLGPEGTVFDPEWESMLCNLTRVYHQPGSIRNLYNQFDSNESYWVF